MTESQSTQRYHGLTETQRETTLANASVVSRWFSVSRETQLFRRVSEVTGGPKPFKASNALVTPLVLVVSMGGGDHLPSGDTSARLPS